MFIDSPRWHGVADKVKRQVLWHLGLHLANAQQMGFAQTTGEQAGAQPAGSPPAQAVETAMSAPAGAVEPAVNVA